MRTYKEGPSYQQQMDALDRRRSPIAGDSNGDGNSSGAITTEAGTHRICFPEAHRSNGSLVDPTAHCFAGSGDAAAAGAALLAVPASCNTLACAEQGWTREENFANPLGGASERKLCHTYRYSSLLICF